jgi:excisionase family DNA binding protein
MERYYSVPEAARALGGVSPWTLRAWLSQGRLERTKMGRRTMVSESALRKFIRNCQLKKERETSESEPAVGE